MAVPLLLLAAVLIFGGCRVRVPDRTDVFFAMDTYVQVIIIDSNALAVDEAFEKVRSLFNRLERQYNAYDPQSLISRINRGGGECDIPIELREILIEGFKYCNESRGAFDLSVGALMELWPFGESAPAPPRKDAVRKALCTVGMSRVILKGRSLELLPGTKLDLGGCLKGYAVRKSIELIGNMGLRRALVNGGGNIQALGEGADGKPWSVGIAHPRKSSAPLASIDLREGEGIATSGDYQRFFIHKGIRYSHLLDPAGGYPARRCISATVLARDAFAADFLSTAVFVLGPVKGISLLRRLGADGLIITEKGQVATEGMKRRLRPPAGEGQ